MVEISNVFMLSLISLEAGYYPVDGQERLSETAKEDC